MKKLLLMMLCVSYYSNAQPSITWQKCLGGTSSESAESIHQTTDGGFILTSYTYSNNDDVSGNHGSYDVWVVKLTNLGVIQWQKCLGGTGTDDGTSIQQTTDGGYILTGTTQSNDGDVSGNHGSADVWVVKLTSFGVIEWQKCLGGTSADYGNSIQQTSDGGFIVGGGTKSIDGDVSGNHGTTDFWVIKLSNLGIIQWQKCLGGTSSEQAQSIQQTSDGGYILTGTTPSNNGDVNGNHGGQDAWVVKLTRLGAIEWQKCLGGSGIAIGSGDDFGQSIKQTTDGGYILAGKTTSNNSDVSGNHGSSDGWVVKLSSLGLIQWQKCLGGSGGETLQSIQQTTDGGYIVIGRTPSIDGDVSGNQGGIDVWVVKLTNLGVIEWQKCLGGTSDDYGYSIQQTTDTDGGYILTGITYSNDGDVSGYHGGQDAWVVNLSSILGLEEPSNNNLASLYPNPVTNVLNLNVENNFENQTYTISNVEGKIINQGIINKNITTLNVEHLSKGVYFIKVADNKVIKFIKD